MLPILSGTNQQPYHYYSVETDCFVTHTLDSNFFSPTVNIPSEGKAFFCDFEMDYKKKSSVNNRIEILEIQVTDLHQKPEFDRLDHKFDLLLSMLTQLIIMPTVVCTPSQATET